MGVSMCIAPTATYMRVYHRICEVCQQPFHTYSAITQYCSLRCRYPRWFTCCIECGVMFFTPDGYTSSHCSHDCFRDARVRDRLPFHIGMDYIITCDCTRIVPVALAKCRCGRLACPKRCGCTYPPGGMCHCGTGWRFV